MKKLGIILVGMLVVIFMVGSVAAISPVKINSVTSVSSSVDDDVIVEAEFQSIVPGVVYVEAGIQSDGQAFSILEAEAGSLCDGNVHYSGKYVAFPFIGAKQTVRFIMKNYGETGTFNGVVGAYTGCLNAGGMTIQTVPFTVDITQSAPAGAVDECSGKEYCLNDDGTSPYYQVYESCADREFKTCTADTFCYQSGTEVQCKGAVAPEFPQSSLPLSGSFSNVEVSETVVVGQTAVVTGTFTADSTARYYIEFGIPEKTSGQQFAVRSITSSSSKCDGSTHYSGDYVTLKKGDSVNFEFYLEGYGREAAYDIVGGAYPGCGSAASVEYTGDEFIKFISVSSDTPVEDFPVSEANCLEGDIQSLVCPDLTRITSAICLNGEWEAQESCGGGKGTNPLLIAGVIGAIVLVLGGIYVVSKPPKKRRRRRR